MAGIRETELKKEDKFNPFTAAIKGLIGFFVLVAFGEMFTPGFTGYVNSLGFLFLLLYCFLEYGPKKGSMVFGVIFLICGTIAGLVYLSSSPHFNEAEKLYDQQKYEEALVAYNLAVEKNPTENTYLYSRGYCYYQLKQYDNALLDAHNALKIEPEYYQAMILKGMAFQGKGEFIKSMSWFKEALKFNSKSTYSHYELARSQKLAGKYSEAIRSYEECMKIDKSYTDALWGIANTYERMGNTKKAIQFYEKYQTQSQSPSPRVKEIIKKLKSN